MDTKEFIRDFITREVLQGARTNSLQDNDQLIELGIIDSMGIITLLSFLEEQFNLQIPAEELVPENFATIATIATLIDRRLGR